MWRLSRVFLWFCAALILVVMAGQQARQRFGSPDSLPILDTLGGNFALESTRGGTTELSDLHGKVVMLNFGYTSCPDVCPTVLARMRDVIRELGDPRIQPVFVTLDPDRDTLERLGPYLRSFDDRFVGMTGTATAIAEAAKPYKVHYERENDGTTISHNSHIYLLDTEGRVRATFDHGVTVPAIVDTVEQLLNEAAG